MAYFRLGTNAQTAPQSSANLEANPCPGLRAQPDGVDNGGCCLDCENNQYCPSNQGCYSADQPGCDGGLCPPLAAVHIPPTTAPPTWSVTLRDCSFSECKQSGCDPVASPFLCATPGPPAPYMGCSSVPWPEDVCANACDVGKCSQAVAPANAPSCKVDCPPEWCAQVNSPLPQQRCPADAPFQCLAGSAAMGCTADEFHFASATDTLCASCCDITSCSVHLLSSFMQPLARPEPP